MISPSPMPGPKTFTTLQKDKNYIIYIDPGLEEDNEVWALSPDDHKRFLILSGVNLWPIGRSPSGKQWLFSGKYSLYVANADGAEIRLVFQSAHLPYLRPIWISENEILVNAYPEDLLQEPSIYQINLETGKSGLIKVDGIDFVQSSFPTQRLWIGDDYDEGRLFIVDERTTTPILEDYDVRGDPYNFSPIQFLPVTGEFIFIATQGERHGFWKSSLSNPEAHILFEAKEGGSIRDFQVSPSGKYLGFVYQILSELIFTVLDIDSKLVQYQWSFPYTLGSSRFQWSPDERYIVLFYQSAEYGSITEINSGIEVMDITTGKTSVLLKEDVIAIVDWIFLK
jgi:hypothetical protein